MAFAVFTMKKGKSSGTSLGNHIDRTKGKEHMYVNADLNKRHLNDDRTPEKFKNKPLSECISQRIAEGYNGKRALRSDAVKYVKCLLTSSTEGMEAVFNQPGGKEKWIDANYKFISHQFGEENIIRFTLHMDEKTPHIHAIIVPLKDGRLTAKEIVGNKDTLEGMQDLYGEMMSPLGLQRGIKGGKAKREELDEYDKRVLSGKNAKPTVLPEKIAIESFEPFLIKETPPLNPLKHETWVEEQNKRITDTLVELQREVNELNEKSFKAQANDVYNGFLRAVDDLEQMKKGKDINLREREGKLMIRQRLVSEKEKGLGIKPEQKGYNRGNRQGF